MKKLLSKLLAGGVALTVSLCAPTAANAIGKSPLDVVEAVEALAKRYKEKDLDTVTRKKIARNVRYLNDLFASTTSDDVKPISYRLKNSCLFEDSVLERDEDYLLHGLNPEFKTFNNRFIRFKGDYLIYSREGYTFFSDLLKMFQSWVPKPPEE